MNTRLKMTILISALLCLLASGSALAQKQRGEHDWRGGPPSIEQKLARISEALDLSNEQSVQMLVVLQEQEESRAALHEQSMQMLGPEICAQRLETQEAILAILTPEQTALFLAQAEQRRQKAANRGRGKNRGGLDCTEAEG